MTITPAQCRGARAMLEWTRGQLVRTAEVTCSSLVMFESKKRDLAPHPMLRVERAFIDAGIVFIADSGEGPGLTLRTQKGVGSYPQPTGPATEVVKQMDAAIEDHKKSKTKR